MTKSEFSEKQKKMIAQRLREIRKGKGWTQREAAKKYGIDYRPLNLYESGDRIPPTHALLAISAATGVSIDYLLGRTNFSTYESKGRIITDTMGLSESAVNRILEIRKKTSPEVKGDDKTDKALIEILSSILQDPSLGDYLTMLRRALVSQKTGDSINSSVIKKEKFYKTLAGQEYEEIIARLMTKDYLVDSDDYDTTTF